jgi:integrase/recombinase XerD
VVPVAVTVLEDLLPAPLAPELAPVVPAAPDRLPAAVYLARLAPGSRRTLRGALDTIAALLTGKLADAMTCPWHLLRYPHTQAVRAALAARYAPATTNKHLAALRGVLKEAWRLGQLDGESYQRAVDLAGVRGTTLPAGRALASAEVRALFEACADGTPGGARDAAMLSLLYGALLRRSESVAVDLADYDLEAAAVAVRHGKGRQERLAYLPAGGRAAVDAWLRVRGDEPGPLLVPVRKGGLVLIRRLSPQAVLYACQKRQRQAPGVSPFSPHDLRRTSIGDLLDAGADLAAVQRLAGHAQVTTTTRYDRRPEAVKRKAAELLQVPFVDRGTRGADR